MKSVVIILALWLSGPAHALGPYAVSPSTINNYVKKCAKIPKSDQMRSEIRQLLSERKHLPKPSWLERFRSLFGYQLPTTANIKDVSLDGLKMTDLNPYDLEVISRLTMHRDAARPVWMSDYVTEQEEQGGTLLIHRKCMSDVCKRRKAVRTVDLTRFNKREVCSDALCAAQRIFGAERGTQILWTYLKYGSNLSQYSDINADPEGFDSQTLKAALIAMETVPEHLRQVATHDTGFYRFLKGHNLAIYDDQPVIANAAGAVFDPIDKFGFQDRVHFFTHELGHRVSYLDMAFWDESDEWKKATGWRQTGQDSWSNERNDGWVSVYAKTSGSEDFAETYSLYRFNPARLKKISPSRYDFMKEHIFQGLEYDQDLCKGQINGVSAAPGTAESTGAR